MVSSAVRASIVVEGPDIGHDAFRTPEPPSEDSEAHATSAREGPSSAEPRPINVAGATAHASARPRSMTALLACFAFIACAGVYRVAQASTADLSVHANFAASDGDEHELNRSAPEPARYQQSNHAPPPVCEKALEPEDIEEDALLGAPAAGPSVHFTPILPFDSQSPSIALAAWIAQPSFSCALPRGPPYPSR